jgi:hypothetical protein
MNISPQNLTNLSKSAHKSRIALPPSNTKQAPHSSKLSRWFETMFKSSCKWSPNFSYNSKMMSEVVLFQNELILQGSRLFSTHNNIIVPKCILEPKPTKHSFQSSKTTLWSSNQL